MKKPNSTVILNCQYHLVNNHFEKVLYIIEKDSKQLITLPNDVETDFGMAKTQYFPL